MKGISECSLFISGTIESLKYICNGKDPNEKNIVLLSISCNVLLNHVSKCYDQGSFFQTSYKMDFSLPFVN